MEFNVDVPYGERLLPHVIDQIARDTPNKVFATIPLTTDWRDGSQDVTYADLSKAVDRAAWWLASTVPKRTCFETLAFTSTNDLRYCFFTLGAVKAGFKLLLVSPRNSTEGMTALLRSTDCNTFLTSHPAPRVVFNCQDQLPISVVKIPDLPYFFEEDVVVPFPFEKTFSEAKQEPFVVLHTSGSTGLPKAIELKHAGLACIDALRNIPPDGDIDLVQQCFINEYDSFFVAMPAFHAAGIFMMLAMPAFSGAKVIMASPAAPMTADAVNEVHVHAKPDASILAPSVWDDLVKNPKYLANLCGLKGAMWGGGPLPQHTGEVLRSFAKIINLYGSTEAMLLPMLVPDQEDFNYFRFYPTYGIEMQPSEHGLSELVIHRKPAADKIQAIFTTFPDISRYSMKDLFSPHPTKAGLWRYEARADDVMVLGNGEKLNPLTMEQIFSSVAQVRGALIVGQGRLQTALLIEAADPPSSSDERAAIFAAIKPAIEVANQNCPAYGRLAESMILLTTPNKPMLRAGKGTIQRQLTLDIYAEEIDRLYAATDVDTLSDLPVGDFHAFAQALLGLIRETAQVDVDGPDADFFASGVDSLAALVAMKHIKAALKRREVDTSLVSTQLFYRYSTVNKLTQKVHELYETGGLAQQAESDGVQEMQLLFEGYTSELHMARQLKDTAQPVTVLLTGSTGSLGSYLLHSLISDFAVSHVYCLNRGSDSSTRQASSHASRGLTENFTNVSFLQADLSAPRLGLTEEVYTELESAVTRVVHNAWPVDFNLSLASFSPSLEGVRNLLNFTALSGASMTFISSISTVGNCEERPIPESVVKDWNAAQALGYAQSKMVAEQMCDMASTAKGVDVAVARVGQVAGPIRRAEGAWNQAEWLPTLIASSNKIRQLPTSLGAMAAIDWVPVDELAEILVERALTGGKEWLHAVNPRKTSWEQLLPTVEYRLNRRNGDKSVRVSYERWVEELARRAQIEDVRHVPGFRLLPFYESLIPKGEVSPQKGAGDLFAQAASTAANQRLAALEAVQPSWMELWLNQWGY